MDVLCANQLAVGYRNRVVLSDVTFSLPKGSLSVLVGSNGSGKSTLLRTLAGQASPLSGTVTIKNQSLDSVFPRHLARLRAFVATERSGGGALTVKETVSIGRFAHVGLLGRLSTHDINMVEEAIRMVGMEGFANRYIGELSDGERQKVFLARALSQDAPVLLLDEPTAFLDVAARVDILNMLRKLADGGKTIVLSTHDIAPAIAAADILLVVDAEKGKVHSGPKHSIIRDGTLNSAFAASGLRFDTSVGDFR